MRPTHAEKSKAGERKGEGCFLEFGKRNEKQHSLRFFYKTTAIQHPPPKHSPHPQAMPVYGIEIVGLVQRLSEREREREM